LIQKKRASKSQRVFYDDTNKNELITLTYKTCVVQLF